MNHCSNSPSGLTRPTLLPAGARRRPFLVTLALGLVASVPAFAQGTRVQTPYANPKVLFDFYLDSPAKMGRHCTGCARWSTR